MIRDTSEQDRAIAAAPGRRWLLAAAAVLVAAALVGVGVRRWLEGERSVDAARIRVAEVQRGTLVRDIVADGRVTAANSPTLYAVAPGIVAYSVAAGDTVSRGDRLAEIASPELESRLAQERATLAGLEAEVGRGELEILQGRANAQKLVDQAEVDRQTVARELERSQEGYDAGVVPELELLRARDNLEKADIALAHARQDSRLHRRAEAFDLRTRRVALDRQRAIVEELERQVEGLVVRSPVDGQIGQLLVAQHASVIANQPVLTVIDLTAFELEIKVPDSFARDLSVGMAAEISAGGATFAGRVSSVSPEVVDSQVASRVQFVGDVPEGLRQNQRLTARILLDEKPGVLMVERGPFVDSGGVIYVISGGVAERRSIRTGAASLDAVEILAGADVGDRIVISGADAFGDAERVRIAGD
jgi:HlyD family secretion protein